VALAGESLWWISVTASPDPDGDLAPDAVPADGTGKSGDARTRRRAVTGRRIRGLEPEQRRQERRRQLLDSAFELFATQGYARTSIEQICQGAYVGFKGFYDEFATKEALFLALYEELVARVSANVAGLAQRTILSFSGLRPLLEVFVRSVLDDRRVAQVLFVEAAGLSPAVEATRRATYRGFADFLLTMWTGSSMVPNGLRLDGLDDHRVPLGIVGAIVELMVDWLVDSDGQNIDQLVDDLEIYCRVVLAGLAALGEAEPVRSN
jgi:AcrR family transcriptional regulator